MTYSTDVPGLPGGPLNTTYPIRMKIVSEGQTINRPGYKARTPRRSVQHGNGNPNALAEADAVYLYNGARNNGVPQQVSYHATGDDTGVWVCVPLDEVTWQAADGDGPGNWCGLSYEMSEYAPIRNDDGRLKKTIEIAADFMGRCAARLGIATPEQHWTFNYARPANLRHDCPNMLRHDTVFGEPAWTLYGRLWNAAKADELKRMGGKPTVETPEPFPITWGKDATEPIRMGREGESLVLPLYGRLTAARDVTIYQGATRKSKVVHKLAQGKTAICRGTHVARDKRKWCFVEYAPGKVGRAYWSAFIERYPTL